MIRFLKALLFAALVLVLGLGTAGCSGDSTPDQSQKGKAGRGADMMPKQMKEMTEKYGRGDQGAEAADQDKVKDKPKEKDTKEKDTKEKDKAGSDKGE